MQVPWPRNFGQPASIRSAPFSFRESFAANSPAFAARKTCIAHAVGSKGEGPTKLVVACFANLCRSNEFVRFRLGCAMFLHFFRLFRVVLQLLVVFRPLGDFILCGTRHRGGALETDEPRRRGTRRRNTAPMWMEPIAFVHGDVHYESDVVATPLARRHDFMKTTFRLLQSGAASTGTLRGSSALPAK